MLMCRYTSWAFILLYSCWSIRGADSLMQCQVKVWTSTVKGWTMFTSFQELWTLETEQSWGRGEEIRLRDIFTVNVAQPWWSPRHFLLHFLIRIFDVAELCGQDGLYGPCPLWWSLCQASGMWTWNEHKINMNNYTNIHKVPLGCCSISVWFIFFTCFNEINYSHCLRTVAPVLSRGAASAIISTIRVAARRHTPGWSGLCAFVMLVIFAAIRFNPYSVTQPHFQSFSKVFPLSFHSIAS